VGGTGIKGLRADIFVEQVCCVLNSSNGTMIGVSARDHWAVDTWLPTTFYDYSFSMLLPLVLVGKKIYIDRTYI